MKINKGLKTVITVFILTLLLASCLIETAKEPKKQYVTIFSDCLTKKDETIFKTFTKKKHIYVKIHFFPTEELLRKIKIEGVNTNADVIILKSIVSSYKAQKLGLYNTINSWKLDELVPFTLRGKNHSWYGIGLDPYVLVTKKDTKEEPEKYAHLIEKEYVNKWTTDIIEEEDILPLYAPIVRKKKRINAVNWYTKFNDNQVYLGSEIKELLKPNFYLTYLSNYVKNIESNDSLNEKYYPLFLNQSTTGSYFNLHTAGVVKQARNFENAQLLIEYIASVRMNEKLNYVWKTVPISLHKRVHPYEYQNLDFQTYKGNVSKQTVNYKYLSRIIKKTKTEKLIEVYYEPITITVADSLTEIDSTLTVE